MYDVCGFGELLVDFTFNGRNKDGYPILSGHPGGAPANFLAAFSKYGGRSAFIGKVGGDTFGKLLEETLQKAGICTHGLIKDASYFTTMAFVTLDENGNRFFSFARKPGADIQLNPDEVNYEIISKSRVFHFGSLSLTNEPSRSATIAAVEFAKNAGCIISFDPNLRLPLWNSVHQAKQEILWGLSMADIVKISDDEVDFLYSTDVIEGTRLLLEQFSMQLVYVTCGENGCYFATDKWSGMVPAIKNVQTIDTTGAGDIFGGSAMWKLLQTGKMPSDLTLDELKDIVAFGCTCAGLSTEHSGGINSVPDIEIVNEICKNTNAYR